MGGTIWLESEAGRAARSTSRRASARRRGSRGAPGAAPGRPARACRVLIVDDNATNRRILQEMLVELGMSADAVASGAEALDALRAGRRRPDSRSRWSLVDGQMPEMDGFMFAERDPPRPALARRRW